MEICEQTHLKHKRKWPIEQSVDKTVNEGKIHFIDLMGRDIISISIWLLKHNLRVYHVYLASYSHFSRDTAINEI